MILKWTNEPTTFAELHERLGGIPLERIRLKPAPGTATEADLEIARGRTCELIDGVLVEKPVGDIESVIATYIGGVLWNHIVPARLGVVIGETGHIRVVPGQLRAADVTYIPWSAIPGDEVPKEAYWSLVPDLIVEVLSPSNTKAEIDRKLGEFFGMGCKLAWVIDPREKTAKVYTSTTRFKLLDETGTLDGAKVLPGLQIPLAILFSLGKKPKNKRP